MTRSTMTGSFTDYLLDHYERPFVEAVSLGAYCRLDGSEWYPLLDSRLDGRMTLVHSLYAIWSWDRLAKIDIAETSKALAQFNGSVRDGALILAQMKEIEWTDDAKPLPKKRAEREPSVQPWRKQHR
jgi:hypothetical protein